MSEPSSGKEPARKLRFGNRDIPLPESRVLRLTIGTALVFGGLLGFLPILGFWMIPLGLLVLSVDIAIVRRWRRKAVLRLNGRKERRAARRHGADPASGEAG